MNSVSDQGKLKKLSNIDYAKQVMDGTSSASTLNHSVESISTSKSTVKRKKNKTASKKRAALSGIHPNCMVIQKRRDVQLFDARAPQPESKKIKLTKDIQNFAQIKTDCFDIDGLINEGNGLRDTEILSIYGKAGLGKTQICHTYAANCLHQWPNSKVVWIGCNNGSFRPSRIKEILESSGETSHGATKLLDNLLYVDVQKNFKSGNTLDGIEIFVKKAMNIVNAKLLIIDSIGNAYKIHRDSKKVGALHSSVSPKMALHAALQSIKDYSLKMKNPIILTNDVVANMANDSKIYSNMKNHSASCNVKPVANIDSHTTAIYRLSRHHGNARRKISSLNKSNEILCDAMFDIVPKGLAGQR